MARIRIALVTGGNKGIGFETARKLGAAGLHVLLGSRDEAQGKTAADTLSAEGCGAESPHLDLDDAASIATAAEAIKERFGRLDILVNNAGIFDSRDAAPGKASLDAVRRVMEVNFIGTLAVTQAMLPPAARSAGGPHRESVELDWISDRKCRPGCALLHAALHRIQRLQGGAEHADDPAA